jgi:alkylation response protein AidB-like acyl-CoA dehydrogenase
MDSPFFNEEHRIFRRSVRKFVDEELNPHVDEWEAAGRFPKEVFKKLGDLGVLGIRYPVEYGGADADIWTTAVFCEEMGRCRSRGLTMSVLVQTDMSSPHLAYRGSDFLKKRYLPDMISGKKVGAIVLSEPDVGSDLANMRTMAKKKGNQYILNGSKTYITNALQADLFFVAAKTDPGAGKKGVSMLLVERDSPGFLIEPMKKKLGMHASDTGELTFQSTPVPAENLIGEENQGFYYVMESLQKERFVSCCAMTSSAQQAIEDTIEYAQNRNIFGKKLSEYDLTRYKLARLQTRVEAARQLTYYAAQLYDRGLDWTDAVSMSKAFCAEVANEVADECLQIHGGAGYIEEYDIPRLFRDLRLWKIGAGTTEVMYYILAKRMGI